MKFRFLTKIEGDPTSHANRVGAVVLGGMLVLLLLVLARVVQIQLMPEPQLLPHIQQRISRVPEPARRGDLLDRRGRPVAGTRIGYRLFVDPTRFEEPYAEKLHAIAEVTGEDVARVAERILSRVAQNEVRQRDGQSLIRYVSVGRVLNDAQMEMVSRLNIPGVHLERRSVRETPGLDLLGPLLGKVGVDHDGLLGAELSFDRAMRPVPGAMDYVRDARGRPLWVEATGYTPGTDGDEVRLSIDLTIQRIVREELERGLLDCDAAGARCVVLDPLSGEVLAMVDVVRDPADAIRWDNKRWQQVRNTGERVRWLIIPEDERREIHPAMARNRCVEDVYEPGSTFKPFMWAGVTARGLAKADEIINTEQGRWRTSYGRSLADVAAMAEQSWADVLINSSNIGMAKGTERLTHQQMHADVVRFGFGRPTGIGLPGEAAGLVTNARQWSKYTHTSVAMGYEVAVTPLQMLRAFSAFAREGPLAGTMPDLRIMAMPEGGLTGISNRVLPAEVATLTRRVMAGVGERLIARDRRWHPNDPAMHYSVFGKSGTALARRPGARGYLTDQYVSSFIAGAPLDHPRIVVVVVIDDPGPELRRKRMHYGTSTAGPVLLRITRRTLEYLGVPEDNAPANAPTNALQASR